MDDIVLVITAPALDARAVVRVLDRSGEVVGAGVLVGPDLVATCAHVVAEAVGADAGGPRPTRAVVVDFPLRAGSPAGPVRRAAQVHRWAPIDADGTGDVAILRLSEPAPAGVVMPPLRRVDRLWDHRFRAFGFPNGMTDGVWTTGRIRSAQGTGWCQLQGSPGDQSIEEGFSGTPVWDDETGAVVGLMVAASRDDSTTAYLIPVDHVLGLDPDLLPCPYRGLEAFGEEHAAFFFGRAAIVDELVRTLAGHPVLLVAGRSGAGKSSLLRAGLVPRLRASGATVAEVRVRAGTTAPQALATALVGALRPQLDDEAAAAASAELTAALAGDDPDHVLGPWAREGAAPRLVLLVDQFEELAAADATTAAGLLAMVVALTGETGDGRLRAALTVRWQSLDDLLTPDLAHLVAAGTVPVPPMSRDQLRDVIVRPAERAPGLAFEDGLVERILDDVGTEPGRLPLLEALLGQLWERREGGYLTHAGYDAAGGVAGSVSALAEELLAALPHPSDVAALRELLTRLAVPTDDGQFVRRPVRRAELGPAASAIVPRLVERRMVVVGPDARGAELVELAHQAIIDQWPRLRDWLADDRDFLVWRDQTVHQRHRWEAGGRDEGGLLRGSALATATEQLRNRPGDVAEPERTYISRSRTRQRRDIRRWRGVTAVLAVLVLAAAGLAAMAVDRENRLDRQLAAAIAENLGQAALAHGPDDPVFAAKLAMAAWRSDPTNAAARTALAQQFRALQSVTAVDTGLTDQPPQAIGLSDDGQTLLLSRADGAVVVTGFGGAVAQRWPLPDPPRAAVYRLSPDGGRVVGLSGTGEVITWDVATRSGPSVLVAAHLGPKDVPPLPWFSTDGRTVAVVLPTGDGASALSVWDVAGRRRIAGIDRLPETAVSSIALTGDQTHVVIEVASSAPGDLTEPVVVRSLADGSLAHSYPDATRVLRGRAVATCEQVGPVGDRNDLVLHDPATGTETSRRRVTGTGLDDCRYLAATREGRYVVEAGSWTVTRDKLQADARMTALDTGTVADVVVPLLREDARGPLGGPLRWHPLMAVQERPGGPPAVVLAYGTTVLRMATVFDPGSGAGDAPREELSVDDPRYLVDHVADHVPGRPTYISRDVTSGRELGRAALSWDGVDTDGGFVAQLRAVLDGGLVHLYRAHGVWRLTRFSLPDLRPVGPVDVSPGPPGPGDDLLTTAGLSSRDDGSRIVTVAGGQLLEWDAATLTPLGAPLALATTPAEENVLRKHLTFTEPAANDEIVVHGVGPDVAIWNIRERRRTAVVHTDLPIDARSSEMAVDPSGTTLVVRVGHVLHVAGLAPGSPARPPIAAPDVATVLGFTADGYLATTDAAPPLTGQKIELWDVGRGVVSGQMSLDVLNPSGASDSSLEAIDLEGVDRHPLSLPLVARSWFDGLCGSGMPDFTRAERAALPAGTDGLAAPCG